MGRVDNWCLVGIDCTSGELLFWDTKTGQMLPAKQMKTVKWETNSCVFSYVTQSFPHFDNKPRSRKQICCAKTQSEDCLIFGDDHGRLSVTVLPCYYEEKVSPDLTHYFAHSKGVANLAVSCDDRLLFSVGERDGCLFQWKILTAESSILNDELKRLDQGT
jgi:hypothetical protein